MTDATLIDAALTDMGPFFQRYDHRQRLLFTAAVSASLVLSAVNVMHGVLSGRIGPIPVVAMWGMGVVLPPLAITGWWMFGELMARGRRKASPADGSHPASADDARNGMRIANAGFVFNLAFIASLLGAQAIMTLAAFGYFVGDLIPRATTVAVGAGSIYLGNLWPRLPTPRTPQRKAAIRMKANRFAGWLMVTFGLLAVLLGLLMPLIYPWVRHHPLA